MTDLDRLIEAVAAGVFLTGPHSLARKCLATDNVRLAHAAFHGDLNAAKRLHDALLPGWALQGLSMFPSGVWIASVYEPKGEDWPKWTQYPSETATDNDPARAWLLAILKAWRAVKEGEAG